MNAVPTPGQVFAPKATAPEGPAYRIFTVESGKVTAGAEVGLLPIKGAGKAIPAVMVGESGRGRGLGVLSVANPPYSGPCPNQGKVTSTWEREKATGPAHCPDCWAEMDRGENEGKVLRALHPMSGRLPGRLMAARLGTTNTDKPKLVAADAPTTDDEIIVVFRTKIGFRGGNEHTGERIGWKCGRYDCDATGGTSEAVPETCPKCGNNWPGPKLNIEPFPGKTLAKGSIAQGAAGRMGGGEQLVAVMPGATVFRTGYSGRLYGGPSAHYYVWDGEQLLSATWDEREVSEVF